jgi:hypothetical protein
MSGRSAHQLLGHLDSDTFALALKRAEALASGDLAGVPDDELPLLRYLAAVQKHLDVVRSQAAASAPAPLNPA